MQPIMDVTQKPPIVTVTEPARVQTRPTQRTWVIYLCVGVLMTLLTVIAVMVLLTFARVMNVREDGDVDLIDRFKSVNRMKISNARSRPDWTSDVVTADVTYHLPQSDETLEETFVVTDNEEDITTKDARIIFDYENGYVVTYYSRSEPTTENICFVRTFDPARGINMARESLRNGKKDEYVSKDIHEELYVPTGETFDRTLLSERAAAMCEDSRLIRVDRARKTEKRAIRAGGRSIQKRQLPYCEGGFLNIRCNRFCVPENVVRNVYTCTNRGPSYWWTTNSCKYVTKTVPENVCVYQCNCLGDEGDGGDGGDGVPGGGETPPFPSK